MENQKIQDESWYQEIATELRQYKKYKARIGVLESRIVVVKLFCNTCG